ncbi:methyltransferase N6AMT1-like isoform X1 [Gigantopelta aegis]|uniref:methyltransferase N6AMT1-like isoform X1 n=1 Tax=Gigantopelta aegis TaxID=1735272 RepID=UPI001B88B72F|nr:methyltransferase N6AMT1-like isoform X1 [Gigantopelta aegis]
MDVDFSTPDLSHLTLDDYKHVYEPAEDSFLLLDALESEHTLLKQMRPSVCLEVGCGSGVCISFLAQIIGPSSFYMCTDINPSAVSVAIETAKKNGVCVQPVISDLVGGLETRLKGCVDILIFNPPYVVTPSNEVGSQGIEASWAGGDRGREVVDRLFPLVADLLSPHGVFYLVIIKENDPDDIRSIMEKQGLNMQVVKSRRSGPEFLSVLKFTRVT